MKRGVIAATATATAMMMTMMVLLLLVNMDMLTCFRGPIQQLSGQQQQVSISSGRPLSYQLLLRLVKDPIQQEENQSSILYSSSIPSFINTVVDNYIPTTPKAVSCIYVIYIMY